MRMLETSHDLDLPLEMLQLLLGTPTFRDEFEGHHLVDAHRRLMWRYVVLKSCRKALVHDGL